MGDWRHVPEFSRGCCVIDGGFAESDLAIPVLVRLIQFTFTSLPFAAMKTGLLVQFRAVALSMIVLVLAAPMQLISQPAVAGSAAATLLPGIDEYSFTSVTTGRDYHVFVSLPVGYQASDTTRYPILYVLDGRVTLAPFVSTARQPQRPGNLIIVGIGYAPNAPTPMNPIGPSGVRETPYRERDFTPPPYPTSKVPSGQAARDSTVGRAAAFLSVLKNEIIPLVEQRYRTNGDRGLHGFSLGGLFTAYVLFEDPDLFTRYGIQSASLGWDDASMFLREEAFRPSRTQLPKRVVLVVGGWEYVELITNTWRLAAALCQGSDNYAGLQLTVDVVPDETHFSPVLLSRSLYGLYDAANRESWEQNAVCSFPPVRAAM
jgi:predicted alpha/beta superfamily hydrolase